MALTLILIALLLLGLGIFQGWTLWYLKREVARLDQRLDESLDDQDLLDFQERLQGLLQQARAAGTDMVQAVERRQEALEKTLVLVREAEKQLVARAQVLEKSADAFAQRAEKLNEGPQERGKARRAPERGARAKPAPAKEAPDANAAANAAAAPAEPGPGFEERARSYLVRPTAAPAPAAAPAAPAVGRHQKIYDLADQGLSRDQIAKESGILPGEVELILNLRPPRRDR